MAISTYSLIIILNVNGLNAPIKRHRELIGLKKENNHQQNSRPFYILPTIDSQTEMRDQEKKFNANGNKKEGQQYSYQKKIDFQTKTVTKGKEAHYIMIKAPI